MFSLGGHSPLVSSARPTIPTSIQHLPRLGIVERSRVNACLNLNDDCIRIIGRNGGARNILHACHDHESDELMSWPTLLCPHQLWPSVHRIEHGVSSKTRSIPAQALDFFGRGSPDDAAHDHHNYKGVVVLYSAILQASEAAKIWTTCTWTPGLLCVVRPLVASAMNSHDEG